MMTLFVIVIFTSCTNAIIDTSTGKEVQISTETKLDSRFSGQYNFVNLDTHKVALFQFNQTNKVKVTYSSDIRDIYNVKFQYYEIEVNGSNCRFRKWNDRHSDWTRWCSYSFSIDDFGYRTLTIDFNGDGTYETGTRQY